MTDKSKPIALIGEDAKERFDNALSQIDINVVYLPRDDRLALPVSSHADMLILKLNDKIICNNDYYKSNIEIFNRIKNFGYQIIPMDFNLSSKYPDDVTLNQAIIGKYVWGLKTACKNNILAYIEESGFEYFNVKQGYAKCSTLILNENAIISSDESIIKAANTIGIDTLKIENTDGNISLSGYNYGFIGGASFVCDNTVYFFGNLDLHSNNKEIRSFCESHGSSVISLDKDMLCDVGGAIILPCLKD